MAGLGLRRGGVSAAVRDRCRSGPKVHLETLSLPRERNLRKGGTGSAELLEAIARANQRRPTGHRLITPRGSPGVTSGDLQTRSAGGNRSLRGRPHSDTS